MTGVSGSHWSPLQTHRPTPGSVREPVSKANVESDQGRQHERDRDRHRESPTHHPLNQFEMEVS